MEKKVFLVLLIIFCASSMFSQEKFIGFELAGSNGLVGFSFDSKFRKDSKFGYKIAVSYGFEKNDGVSHWYFSPVKAYYPQDGQLCNFYSIPINIHYLFGRKKHFLETALGLNIFATDYSFGYNNRIGYFTFGRIAYRYESITRPLLFSVGIDAPFRTPGSGLGYSFGITPTLTVGYKL